MISNPKNARQWAHQANIDRYQRLLKTYLTDNERAFIERRIDEEKKALRQLVQTARFGDSQMQHDFNLASTKP